MHAHSSVPFVDLRDWEQKERSALMSANTCLLHPAAITSLYTQLALIRGINEEAEKKQKGTDHKHFWPPAICYLHKQIMISFFPPSLFPSKPPWLTCSHSGDVMVVGHGERNPLWVLTCRAGLQGAVQREGVAGCQSRKSKPAGLRVFTMKVQQFTNEC